MNSCRFEIYASPTRVPVAWAGIGLLVCAVVGIATSAVATTPETYRSLWEDAALVKRIDDNIERNRKGDLTLELVTAEGRPLVGATLDIQQQTHAFLFGANAFVLGQLDTPEKNLKYEQQFTKLFNFATVPLYWEGTEPTRGELRYAEGSRHIWRRPPPDRFLPFAKKYGLTLKGHPLVWHLYNPAWLPQEPDELRALYRKRLDEISASYSDAFAIWDVVNESQTCKKPYPLYTEDRAYVGWAFGEAARRFGANNLLMINETTDHSHVAPGQSAYLKQVKSLQEQQLRVQGVGFQFHFFSEQALQKHLTGNAFTPPKMLDVYEAFAALKLPLYVTEITIPTLARDNGEAVQAEVVRNLYRLWFSAPRMAGITWWNLADGTAVKGENGVRGGLLDDKLDPKPAYRVLDQLINQDWKTKASLTTDSAGKAQCRGFYGKYVVQVKVAGTTRSFDVDLSTTDAGPRRLVWQTR